MCSEDQLQIASLVKNKFLRCEIGGLFISLGVKGDDEEGRENERKMEGDWRGKGKRETPIFLIFASFSPFPFQSPGIFLSFTRPPAPAPALLRLPHRQLFIDRVFRKKLFP